MTQEVYEKLAPEYAKLNAAATVLPSRQHEVSEVAERLIHDKAVYLEVEHREGVPAAALMALSMREMNGNLHCYLGNGQALSMRTTIVPYDRGPFDQPSPENFYAGCHDALVLDGWVKVFADPANRTMTRICYQDEGFNGFGYRYRGIPSPYVYGATTVQRPGKFIRDRVFDPNEMDPQIGTLAIMLEIFRLDPSLDFTNGEHAAMASPDISVVLKMPIAPHPIIGNTNVFQLQTGLNKLRVLGTPIDADGNYGRHTMRAVANFQIRHRLRPDGLAGPLTMAAIHQALAEAGL